MKGKVQEFIPICEVVAKESFRAFESGAFSTATADNKKAKRPVVLLFEILGTMMKMGIKERDDSLQKMVRFFAKRECRTFEEQSRSALSYFRKFAG